MITEDTDAENFNPDDSNLDNLPDSEGAPLPKKGVKKGADMPGEAKKANGKKAQAPAPETKLAGTVPILKYNQKVRLIGGFYDGQAGIVLAIGINCGVVRIANPNGSTYDATVELENIVPK